ncbi:MAG: GNAT family N-acetyltransferase [Angelakisella sp.]|jgi:ElaA protein|nr:GNAT family N-acetyltransferase [Angelakisella sp.]
MELTGKHFSELTTEELFDIYKLRVSVFVVEQNCPYQEVDSADKTAYHIWLKEDGELLAYLRVLPRGVVREEVSLGRVIAVRRRCGLGSRILAAGIRTAVERFGADCIVIEAQTYARGLYEKAGFVQTSEEFLEDGIPHIQMTWRP